MAVPHIRDFDPADLDDAVARLERRRTTAAARPLFPVAEVIEALGGGEPAVVAVDDGRVVGTCVARVTGERAWVLRIAIDPGPAGAASGPALLRALEQRLLRMGVTRIAALLPEGGVGHEAFLRQGYALTPGVEYFEKREPLRPRRPRRPRRHGRPPHRRARPGTSWTGWRTPRS